MIWRAAPAEESQPADSNDGSNESIGHSIIRSVSIADRSCTRMGIKVEVLRVVEVGPDLQRAYGALLVGLEDTYPDDNRFEVLSARRISSAFKISEELSGECFRGQRTVEAWEFEVFRHLGDERPVLQVTSTNTIRRQP
jgi:hypothetical protein